MNYLNMNNQKLLPVVIELNTLLADYNIYYQKLRSCHWNVVGKNFFDLHQKFEELYNDAKIKVDDIAERILTLRYHPVSKFSEYLKLSSLKESSPLISDNEMVEGVLSDHRQILVQMKIVITHAENAGDEGTIDMMGGFIAELEKSSWMLDAWAKENHEHLKTHLIDSDTK